ncbi:MAG: protein kinase [Deltaproteobacteria bacterium]|nr:protein kinase [Deltaproteobacteria bacterium]
MNAPDTERSEPTGIGEVIADRYELLEVLGDGLSGKVYRARDLFVGADPEIVALKVLHRELLGDRQLAGRFRREAQILARLSGPHLARFIEVVEEPDALLLSLEFVEGPSLETFLGGGRKLPLAEVVALGAQICEALACAHEEGVVHRDLKPSNVLVGGGFSHADGSFRDALVAKVVDFGLAKIVAGDLDGAALTERDMVFGTPEFMAPEQIAGEVIGPAADLYATGVLLYWLLVGRVPFERATPVATMQAHLSEPPPPPREVAPERAIPAALEAVVLRALGKTVKERPASARELASLLLTSINSDAALATTEAGTTQLDATEPGVTEPGVTEPGVTMRSLKEEVAAAGRGARVQVVMPDFPTTTQTSLPASPAAASPERRSSPERAGAAGPLERLGPPTRPSGGKVDDERGWLVMAALVGLAAIVVGTWLGLR